MSYLRRAENKRSSTKAELVALNSDLSTEVARLRNQVSDLTQQKEELVEALALMAAKPLLDKIPLAAQARAEHHELSLNARAKALALRMHCQVRVRNNTLEVFLHGGWNDINTVAIPT